MRDARGAEWILGLTRLRRPSRYLRADGESRDARFEKRLPSIDRREITWSFASNPFMNTSHARWFSGLTGQLGVSQVRRAFEAAGATPLETQGFAQRLVGKFQELRQAVAQE